MSIPDWLLWGQNLQALAQNGLTYSTNPFDRQRFEAVQDIAAQILSAGTQSDIEVIRNIFDKQAGYTTPKVDVRGVVFRDRELLLVKELSDGLWTLPGGWVDVNEPPTRAVEREVWEESGFKVKARKLLAVYDRNLHGHPPYLFHIYKLFILCDLTGGKPANSIETGEATFFAHHCIPPLSLPRTTPEEVDRMYIHLDSPDLPTDFD